MPEVLELAAVRPDDWNLALFVHVLGAMVVTGAIVLAFVYLVLAWRGDSPRNFRAGFRALLYGAIPGYIVMRGGSEWILSKEGLGDLDPQPDWIGIGYVVADTGLLLLLIATIASGVASRRALAADEEATGGTGAIRTSAVLCGLVLVAYVIAVWAMTTKPA